MTTITAHTTSQPSRQPSRTRKPLRIAVAGAFVALAVAAGVGTWQANDHRTVSVDRQPAALAAAPSVPSDTPASAHPLAQLEASQTLYLVATEEEAVLLRNTIFNMAPDPAHYRVMVLDPATDGGMLRGLGEMNNIRYTLGLPPIEVIDLRGS